MSAQLNQHLGKKLRLRRTSLGLTQTQVAKAINVTFQQIQKYEKGTNGVSSARLLQLSSFLKVPIKYFFEDYQDFTSSNEENSSSKDVNYSFLLRIFSDLEPQQKEKLLEVLGEHKNIKKAI
ncbi:helix-turn-helix domain-containing protein [Candidatus Pelagibacter sp. HIMB1517]|uniref:helix-turn-helix domain-containing protein n=1 Tax=Candidatus Pelagibacter sp. HIMB1517 TaxID=3413341 RepID=UPI003F863E42